MADQQPTQGQGFPRPDLTTIYVDGAWSLTTFPNVVKIYFHRNDPGLAGDATSTVNHTFQMVMPQSGFVGMAVFFEAQLKIMIESNRVTQAEVDQWRDIFPNLKG